MTQARSESSSRGIARVEALHYRSLRYIAQELRPFQLLVGPNASGKSSFLDVVAFLGDLLRTDLDTAVRGDARLGIALRAPDPRHLTWLREGDAFELAVELAVPTDVRPKGNGVHPRIRYELRVEVGDPPRIAVENVWLKGGPSADRGRQTELFPSAVAAPQHIVRLPRRKTLAGWKKVISRGGDAGQVYFMAETTGWNSPFALSAQKPALAGLPEDEQRFPAATWLRRALQSGVHRVSLSSEAMRRPCPPTRQAGYLPDGSNLPYVVSRLQAEAPDRLALWVSHVREALPDVETITSEERPEDRHRYLVVHYRTGLKAPSWLVSDGTLRLLALTLLAYAPGLGGTYLIEEPENGIHPRAVETVFQSLRSVYRAQILLATHSPVILGMASPDDLLCFARTPEGVTDIIAGREHPRLKQWQGALDLSTLFATGVLG